MYKLRKLGDLYKICIRGNNLTKKLNKNNSKQTMVYLRSPKHFNIGKHKILSFLNYFNYNYYLNLKLHVNIITNHPSFLFNTIVEYHKFHLLHKISSIRITSKIRIKWH